MFFFLARTHTRPQISVFFFFVLLFFFSYIDGTHFDRQKREKNAIWFNSLNVDCFIHKYMSTHQNIENLVFVNRQSTDVFYFYNQPNLKSDVYFNLNKQTYYKTISRNLPKQLFTSIILNQTRKQFRFVSNAHAPKTCDLWTSIILN